MGTHSILVAFLAPATHFALSRLPPIPTQSPRGANMTNSAIIPTVGRIVWFFPHGSDVNASPLAAIVTAVWSSTRVNIAVFDKEGLPFPSPPTSVLFVQDGDQKPESGRCYACWPDRLLGTFMTPAEPRPFTVFADGFQSLEFKSLAIGDRLREKLTSLVGMGKLLQGIDLTLADDIYAAVQEALVQTDAKAKLTAWLAVLKLVSAATKETTVDDQLAAAMEKIIASGLGELLAAIVERLLGVQEKDPAKFAALSQASPAVLMGVHTFTAAEAAQFEAASIDPATVMQIVQLLMALFAALKK